MEKTSETATATPTPGSKHSILKESFRRCPRFLLTAFPFEDFSRAFPRFTGGEQQRLYELYVQVITSLYENIQDDFDSRCQETQVGTILDTVERYMEQQILDPLCSHKTNLAHIKHDLLALKKNEVRSLEEFLEKVEDQKHSIKARIKLLKKKCEDPTVNAQAADEMRRAISKFGSYNEEVDEDH